MPTRLHKLSNVQAKLRTERLRWIGEGVGRWRKYLRRVPMRVQDPLEPSVQLRDVPLSLGWQSRLQRLCGRLHAGRGDGQMRSRLRRRHGLLWQRR